MVSIVLLEVCTMTVKKSVVIHSGRLPAAWLKWKIGNEKPSQTISCTTLPIRVWVRLKVLHSKTCGSGLSNCIHSHSQVPCPRGVEPNKLMTKGEKQPSLHNRRRARHGPVSSSTYTPAFLILLGKHNTAILNIEIIDSNQLRRPLSPSAPSPCHPS